MTEQLLRSLQICHDLKFHSAAMNMAIDEALLESVTVPTIRFYRWRSLALSFGYFGRFSDLAAHAEQRDLVRRWTGGGIVFHGEDLTYSIVIPSSEPVFGESSVAIYEKIHRALADALNGIGQRAVVAGGLVSRGIQAGKQTTFSANRYDCFANPVRADVMMDGRKVAGAAQRRTHNGLLQQGSIQGFGINADLAQRFSEALSGNRREYEVDTQIFQRAREFAHQKYGSESWLKKR